MYGIVMFQVTDAEDHHVVDLAVADARQLPYPRDAFDAVIDKGTLDAIFLIGESREERLENLSQAVSEMARVLKPGGILWSLSAICVDALQDHVVVNNATVDWKVLNDGSFFMTSEGYASNNVDGTMLVYRAPE